MGAPSPVPLSGVDLFHVRVHQEMRWRGLAGNRCALALELDGRVDEQLLAARLQAARVALPELGWRLGRSVSLQPVWRQEQAQRGPSLVVRSSPSESSVLAATTELLDGTVSNHSFELVLLRGRTADAVVLRWLHPAADARGATRLLGWLGEGTGARLPEAPPPAERLVSADDRIRVLDPTTRWRLLGAYRNHVLGLARRPIVSLDTATGRRPPGRTRAVRLRLDGERSRAFAELARRHAGSAETSLLVHGAARLLDRALKQRASRPERHLLVVPVSLDPKQRCRRMFGNNLTMMMLTVDREQLADRATTLRSLAQQRRAIVRERLDVAMLVALDAARYLPAPVYSWFSRRPFGSERMSMLVTDPGEVPIREFLGVPVADALLVPAAVLPPGLQLVASRHDGRLALMVVFVDSVIGGDEVRALLEGLIEDVLADA